jgi:hypothetical protein
MKINYQKLFYYVKNKDFFSFSNNLMHFGTPHVSLQIANLYSTSLHTLVNNSDVTVSIAV